MLSKEQKLRYGEILRQQMKEKEERKRIEDLSKRQAPIPKIISAPTIVPDPSIYLSEPSPDPKEQLQKQLEKQDYNPFGKAGGGAPNRRQPQTVTANDPNYSQLAQQSGEYGGSQLEPRYPSQQLYDPREGYRPQFAEQPRMQEPQRPPYQEYPPAVSPQSYQRKQPEPPRYEPPQMYEQQPQRYQPQAQRFEPPQQRFQPPPQPQQPQQRFQPMPPIPMPIPAYELPPDTDQLQQMYRRGGRNLLKLQNETANEHIVKQRQKLQMQAFLRQQMEEAERRKQQEKDRLKREEIEQERRNREYIEMQNFKLREEERRKQQEKQRIVDQNARNLAKRKELQQQAKDKLQRQERQRQEAANRRQASPPPHRTPSPHRIPEPLPLPLPRHQSDSSSLSSSSATTHHNFNTDISKQFFKQQREATRPSAPDRKLEMVTAQIERMRAEINNQGDMFQQELHRIKLQAELAQQEKMKAELEIERLKLELERKNQEAELRLMQAVKRNDPYQQSAKFNGYNYQPQQERLQPPNNYQNHSQPPQKSYQPNYQQNNYEGNNSFQSPPSQPPPPQNRPMAKQTRVPEYQSTQKSYSAKGKLQDLDYHPKLSQSGVATLQADSKKIPINLPANRQLTLSKIQHYGKDNSYYQQEPQRHLPKQQIIPEQDEEERPRAKSRQNEDELDKLMQSRSQKKWQMSTVKDDFNKEIEELLKQKDYRNPQSNQMSQAGRQIVSREGLPYDGPNLNSLNSNKQSMVSNGTVDVDKIHDRNEARLRELRALGVETINTTNDEDMNRLDAMLKNYR